MEPAHLQPVAVRADDVDLNGAAFVLFEAEDPMTAQAQALLERLVRRVRRRLGRSFEACARLLGLALLLLTLGLRFGVCLRGMVTTSL